jgi:hypothetical protein
LGGALNVAAVVIAEQVVLPRDRDVGVAELVADPRELPDCRDERERGERVARLIQRALRQLGGCERALPNAGPQVVEVEMVAAFVREDQ